MLASTQNGHRQEQGFTLVELAIVLVIVGLLIGGILKGQELIASTRVTSTAAQIRAIEAATNNFFDTFGAMPGDLVAATNRLPNCAAAGSVCLVPNGNGNGRIAQTPDAAMAINAANENVGFFAHLAAAELISGVLPTSNALNPGQGLLGTPIGAGTYYRVGFHPGGVLVATPATANPPNGHYLSLSSAVVANALTNANIENLGIQPKAAQKIDSKYDDGVPDTGSVLGANTTASTITAGCINGANYNSRNIESDCGIYIRFYQ